MKPIQKPKPKSDKHILSTKRVQLYVVSDKERQDARISAYEYILP